jgi:hypothetical protein
MSARMRWSIAAVAATTALAFAPAVLAAGVSRQRAASIAKRAASARVERFGISYLPSAWRAACDARPGGGWRCAVGTGGQCSGVVTVSGSSVRPRVRTVDVSCAAPRL